jgi:hypothetical protein
MKAPVISVATRRTRQRTWHSRPERFVVRVDGQALQFASIAEALDYADTFGGRLFDEGNIRRNPHDPLFGGWFSDEVPVTGITYR